MVSFNPRTPCGVRQWPPCYGATAFRVSIHALLAECDRPLPIQPTIPESFNPRTPCGVRLRQILVAPEEIPFQSTHSLRSATEGRFIVAGTDKVSIHALLAECDTFRGGPGFRFPRFNPRTPCGVRPSSDTLPGESTTFQSTHSLRSATDSLEIKDEAYPVSIHALLAECDFFFRRKRASDRSGFNPRTPCGVRRNPPVKLPGHGKFQSTHSLRSATCEPGTAETLEEFQSTHSLRSATDSTFCTRPVSGVSIHALLAECDNKHRREESDKEVSIHALLAECDDLRPAFRASYFRFNPRTPCGVRLRRRAHRLFPGEFQSTHSLRSAT